MGPVVAHVLDNPVWSSVRGAHGGLASLAGNPPRAGRYRHDISPFGAVADPSDPRSWRALDELLEGHGVVVLVDPERIPEAWVVTRLAGGAQMVGTDLRDAVEPEALPLGAADVTDMLALVERTRPGPFLARTYEMGNYFGIRREGALVAMAGERLHPDGWTEISAVCTDAASRGQGLATRLVQMVASGIRARGEEPFLHVAETNANAIRLYKSIGFHVRRTVDFVAVKRAP